MNDDLFSRIRNDEFKNKLDWKTTDKHDYAVESDRLDVAFRAALFEEYEVTLNPKKDICYAKAYEFGHSSGYHEIAIYFADLVDLIK